MVKSVKVEKLGLKTKDLHEENISKLSELFPQLLTEMEIEETDSQGKVTGKKLVKTIDSEKLKELVGDYAKKDSEIYELTWAGKQKAIRQGFEPTTKTLRPLIDDKESVDFENTQNLYIEGDNLEVLKILRKSYSNSIKMIYIDPPYNTGKDFVYKDKFAMSAEDYNVEAGVVDEDGNKLVKNTGTDGRYHSNWLNMMYPRLQLAHKLLKKDGVIFISIDDNEVVNLKKACDEIFGENNFVAQLPRITTIKGKNDEKKIASSHDYVLVYSEINAFSRNSEFRSIDRYKLEDERGKYYVEATLDAVSLPYQKSLDFEIFFDKKKFNPITYNGKKISWRWSRELVEFGIKNNLIINKNGRLYTKTYLEYEIKKGPTGYDLVKKEIGGTYRSQILLDYKFSNNEASRAIKELNIPFDYSKPVELVKQLIKMIPNDNNDIILDFFSGSATTAHAVMQLNSEDGNNRKFIMIQFPEETDKDSEAFKAGYKNICEIGKERIRRAAKKIKDELKEKNKQQKLGGEKIDIDSLDFGFRVFKLDSSNMDENYYNPMKAKQADLVSFKDNVKKGRSEEDLLFQVLLDVNHNIPLSAKVELKKINGQKVFIVADGLLIACFDKNIDLDLVKELVKIENSVSEKIIPKFVFRESSFKDDSAMINSMEYLKTKLFKTDAELKANVKVI